jgi:CDP-glucose 4,6-dehydratase
VSIWAGRRVFVTGHTGFKGSWLSLWLEHLGAEVTGYSLPAASPSLHRFAGLTGHFRETLGDTRDLPRLAGALEEAAPEIVFHLAAQPLVRASHGDPIGTFGTNVMGTAHLLEAARRCTSIKAMVMITTDKVYHNAEQVWPYRESDPLGGDDPYSSSKACAEHVCFAYRRTFFDAPGSPLLATTRAGNVIGGGDWAADRLIPDLMRAFSEGQAVRIRSPDAVRPWQHVLDPLKGYLTLAERLFGGEARLADAWNFAPWPTAIRTVGEVATTVAALWGDGARCEIDGQGHPPETHRLTLDPAKAVTIIGWRPRLEIDAALRLTVDWYRAWHRGADVCSLTLGQIEAYEGLCRP